MKSKKLFLVSAVMVAVSLVGCGGGGGGDNSTLPPVGGAGTVPSQLQQPVPILDSALVQTLIASTHAFGSEEYSAFNRLNAERLQCGFGALKQNVQIDSAARSHNDYQIINNMDSHFENKSQFPTGFTGINGSDRVAAAGYKSAAAVGDLYTFKIGTSNKTGWGEAGIRGLLNAPYHMADLLDGYRDVGLSVRSSRDTTPQGISPAIFLHVNPAYKTSEGPQLIAAKDVATYPCDGTTGVNRQLVHEDPNPVPGRDLRKNPIGSSIYILLREGNVLTITSASMFESASNTAIVLRTPITKANDPNSLFKINQGYVTPDAPLKANTLYSVEIRGTNNGAVFTRQFTFTTGA